MDNYLRITVGIPGVDFDLVALEDRLEDRLLVDSTPVNTYYYSDIVNVSLSQSGTLRKKTHMSLELYNGYEKSYAEYVVKSPIQVANNFVNYVNQKAMENPVEAFQNRFIDTSSKPFYNLKLGKDSTMYVYPDGVIIYRGQNVIALRYSQLSSVRLEANPIKSIIFTLRTSTGSVKELKYNPSGHFNGSKINMIVNFIDGKIQECEYNNNVEILQSNNSQPQNSDFKRQYRRFECLLLDSRATGLIDRNQQFIKAVATIHDEYLLIEKKSTLMGSDRGSRKIFYSMITAVDLDKGGTFSFRNAIEIIISGSERIVLEGNDKSITEKFYETLISKVNESRMQSSNQANTNIGGNNMESSADELLKWFELKEKGVITDEEFEIKKRELL